MPIEDEADAGLDYWGGVVPLQTVRGEPEPDEYVGAGVRAPRY
jgi:hypothetical protein